MRAIIFLNFHFFPISPRFFSFPAFYLYRWHCICARSQINKREMAKVDLYVVVIYFDDLAAFMEGEVYFAVKSRSEIA